MPSVPSRAADAATKRPAMRGVILLLAGLMALNALAIDTMLPALPMIGADLGVAEENRRQLIIIVYFLGFGSTQLLWGPLADRFGRKPVLLTGIALYVVFAGLCALAWSFPLLLAARFAMGASAAVTRVLVTAMVRDLFEGAEMARVMSLTFMVFMAVPMMAPSLGQAILLLGPWRWIFAALALWGIVMGLWSWRGLAETLHPEHRRPLDAGAIGEGVRRTLGDRLSLGYALAMTTLFGALTGYIVSIQQIVSDVYGAGDRIGLVFAAVALPMAGASWINSRIVRRFGVRRVSHAGLIAFVVLATVHALHAELVAESLWTFVAAQAVVNGLFAFVSANFGTLAMRNMAPIAGTASSVQGVINNFGAGGIGYLIGRSFDGTLQPFLWGMAAAAIASLAIVLVTERGILFRRLTAPEDVARDEPGLPRC